MEVFSESYLEEVIETQGQLFEYAEAHCPEIDTADFINTYMKSSTRAKIDEGQAYLCTMDAGSLFDYFLKYDGYIVKNGKTVGGFAANWIGQFYALFQWIYKIPSKEVVELLPVRFMFEGYPGLHDLDLRTAVGKVGEQCGLKSSEGRKEEA